MFKLLSFMFCESWLKDEGGEALKCRNLCFNHVRNIFLMCYSFALASRVISWLSRVINQFVINSSPKKNVINQGTCLVSRRLNWASTNSQAQLFSWGALCGSGKVEPWPQWRCHSWGSDSGFTARGLCEMFSPP